MRIFAAAALAWLALPSPARAASLTSAGPGLVVDDRGSAAETRALKRIAASLARSRTAAGLLQELAIIGDAKIAFSSSAASRVDASTPFVPDRVTIQGQLAWADFSEPQLRVFLDEKLLPYNPDRVAPILAHELLGHSLPLLRADKAGLGRKVFARFDSNEIYACLVDAAVSIELRNNAYESQAASLMRSTAAYMADIRFLSAGYALALGREEAADPAKAYRSRLAEARASLGGLPAERRRWKAREALLKHLVDEDGMARQILKTARSEVRYRLDTQLPDRGERLAQAAKALEEELADAATPAGKADWKLLAEASDHPFLHELDEKILFLQGRLAELKPDAALPRKEWVDWTAVRAIAQEDLLRHDGLDLKAVRSAFSMAAAPAKSPWRKETVKGLFSASVPADWMRREFQYVSEPGTAFTDGLSRISAELHGEKASRYPSIAEFLRQMENLGGALKKKGTVKVAGQECPRFQRRREMRHHEEGRVFWEYTYEEYALRKVQRGFWILEFSHASPMYDAKPDGLDAWARFLATFRPL